LSDSKQKRVPNIFALLKAYPALGIHAVNRKGDFAGCIAKNDYDINKAFAKIKGKFYNIGSIGGIYACALGMNDKGQVVGIYEYREGERAGFTWSNGKITKLPALDINDGSLPRAEPSAISNNGIIVGMSRVNIIEKNEFVHAVRWVNGKIEDLVKNHPNLNIGDNRATDINSRGQILIIDNNPVDGIFIWQNGTVIKANDFFPNLEANEKVVFDGGTIDQPEFGFDGTVKLRIEKWEWVPEPEKGDEYFTLKISTIGRFKVKLPPDIRTIPVNSDKDKDAIKPLQPVPILPPSTPPSA
jgi:probable HAF family extracellular repeat protein